VFWLIKQIPIMKIHFKCILKNSNNLKKNSRYASEHFMSIHQSFGVKKTFFVPCVKKTKNRYVNSNFIA
jgi:hypothetical protein